VFYGLVQKKRGMNKLKGLTSKERTKMLLSVCVGDALGAPLEFLKRLPTRAEIQNALKMRGGGIIGVEPGQVTDDSEMMICLYKSIIDEAPSALEYYKKWMKSKPIDIGITTRKALLGIKPTEESQSNGSLMRCAPIGFLYQGESDEFIAQKAKEDASLTHANTTVQDATACYCIALAHSLNGRDGYLAAMNWVTNKEVRDWLLESTEDVLVVGSDGYVRWGFIMAFWHLQHSRSFVDAMIDTMSRGGDTDTNCAIVAGLVATKHPVPEYMIEAVVNSDSGRPHWLHPKSLYQTCH